jgi:nitrogen fixation protein NifU and related proteins
MSDIYREKILDHYKNPRNYGSLSKPDASIEDTNPLCGDCLTFELKCNTKGTITDVAFTARGCALSVAAASILTENIKGRNVRQLKDMDHKDIQKLLEIKIGAGRIKCALLPLAALRKAIKQVKIRK